MARATERIRDPGVPMNTPVVSERADGIIDFSIAEPLGPFPVKLTEKLDHWAAVAPDRTWIAARDAAGGWRRITYGEGRAQVRVLAAALLRRGLSAERPLMILSGNDLEHALLGMAALYAGIAYAPVSPAYALISSDFSKLRYIYDLLTPGLVFAADGAMFGRALDAILAPDLEIIVTCNAPASRKATLFADLLGAEDDASVDAANAAITADTIGKFLFTSGSTGNPKGVINTQRMLCGNAEMITAHFAYFRDTPPVVLDWSPWNHTAGGNHNFNPVLYNGGSFYIDEGKPVPGAIAATVRNLRDVSPTWHFSVPRGYDALLPYLRNDAPLAHNFLKELRLFWYAGAGMAAHVWEALDEIALKTCGERIVILSALGSTETAPAALGADARSSASGNVGTPLRGVQLKLVPAEGKYEARFKSPGVTPGYWRQPEVTAKAFDDEGFYCMGDALRFADRADPARGLYFDGRLAEDFKLATGTWVAVGPLRAAFIDQCAPLVKDVVLAGLDRDEIVALIFPDMDACRALAPDAQDDASVLAAAAVRAAFAERLERHAKAATGSATRIVRAVLLAEPPSIDRHELTDKGSINQRAVLANRAEMVDLLYQADTPAAVIVAR